MSRLLVALVLVSTSLLGACRPEAGACDVVMWPSGQSPLPNGATVPADVEPLVGADDVDWEASRIEPGDTPLFTASFKPEAAGRLADHTRNNVGSFLAIALNGQVVSSPMILTPIEDGIILVEGIDGPASFAAFGPCVRG